VTEADLSQLDAGLDGTVAASAHARGDA
jgi:hypothetical protein